VNTDKKEARLTVSDEDLSKAIGRRGQNARLTSRLVGMDLVIEKDEHAAEVFEGQMGSAVHHLVDALGITADVARLLTQGGMGDLKTLATGVDVSDIAEVLGGDDALAQQIFDKAAAHASSPSKE